MTLRKAISKMDAATSKAELLEIHAGYVPAKAEDAIAANEAMRQRWEELSE